MRMQQVSYGEMLKAWWGMIFAFPSAVSAAIIDMLGVVHEVPVIEIFLTSIIAAASTVALVAAFLFVIGAIYWLREQLQRKIEDPRKDVRASFAGVALDELALNMRISFSLMVYHCLDAGIIFAKREIGHMKYADDSLTRKIKLPSAEVVPSPFGEVIGGHEEKEILLLQRLPPDVTGAMLTSYESGKQQIFDWIDIRVPFQYQGKEYLLRIPQGVYFRRASGSVSQVGEIEYGATKTVASVRPGVPEAS
jgi:hypothetical protein